MNNFIKLSIYIFVLIVSSLTLELVHDMNLKRILLGGVIGSGWTLALWGTK